MKQLLLVLAALLVSDYSQASSDTHRALYALNSQWARMPQHLARPADRPLLTDQDWIQYHLMLVEEHLRTNIPAGLTKQQRMARQHSLEVLQGYRLAGRFPKNETHPVRTPVFFDAYGTFCAVGFLLDESGAGALARSVSAQNNFVYLPDLGSSALDAWAREHGFTRDELAWIQPAYPPSYYTAPVGGGTNGSVNELLVSSNGQKLYVGGQFTQVAGSVAAPNIAYITESAGAYTWHNIGTGLEGPVNALAEWDGKLFAGGKSVISQGLLSGSLAFWNGTAWTMAGQTSGDVYDLAIFRDTLYASGDFNTASGSANFARWDGSQWIPISGLAGTVYTMEAIGPHIFLGGGFLYDSDTANAIRWNSEGSFLPFANRMWNEVRDFEIFKDTVYASCRFTSGIVNDYIYQSPNSMWFQGRGSTDTNLICQLVGNSWQSHSSTPLGPLHGHDSSVQRRVSINTLYCWNDTLIAAGDLAFSPPMFGNRLQGVWPVSQPFPSPRCFIVDSAINKLAVFKGTLFAGGRMKSMHWAQLNGICRQAYSYQQASVRGDVSANLYNTLIIHPNPARTGGEVSVTAPFAAQQIRLLDAAGRTVWSLSPKVRKELSFLLPSAAGHYIVEWVGDEGKRASGIVVAD